MALNPSQKESATAAEGAAGGAVDGREQSGLWSRAWPTILAVWLTLSLVSAAQRYADSLQNSPQTQFGSIFLWSLAVWAYWALAAPLIFRLGRWLSLTGRGRGRAWAAHLLLAGFFGLLHVAYFAALGVLFGPVRPGLTLSFLDEFVRVLRVLLYVELLLYWAILGAGAAHDSYRRYRERELRARELESSLNLAQLQALKMQIHPHFLFNSLNTISMLIRNRENDRAVQMVAGLGELLRSSLDESTAQEVQLSAELDFVRRYLRIEQFRFPDRLRVEIDVPEELLAAQVPNLILQPLVENAVRHGVARSPSAGLVRIAACRRNGWLELCVQDDGVGFAGGGPRAAGQGLGLKNTRARLERLYGARHELTLQNADPSGALVRLRVPFRRSVEGAKGGKDQSLNR